MCGIAGVVSPDPSTRSFDVVRRMLGALSHRGPDDEGVATDRTATIGARRLAIIDVANGRQPMCDESGDIIAVQNGEIYNFRALRTELQRSGHRFATASDTEVLPHAYEEWGDDLVSHLNGMFALAIWDGRRGRLVLARDRFGKKPLVYLQAEGSVVFASEISALLQHPLASREVDDEAIAQYLVVGYVPAPRTGFTKIMKVPPAHVVAFSDGRTSAQRYWQLSFEPKLKLTPDEVSTELRTRIEESVRLRLISDVPIGAFLSGGLDSSTVVAYMAKHSSAPVKTFAVGFGEPGYDELSYARLVAREFATDHQELMVDPNDTGSLPMLAAHLGEPFADSSIVPTYQIARATRQHVTVALNGDGGDELFAGYDRYRAIALAAATIDRLPESAAALLTSLGARLPTAAATPAQVLRLRRFLTGLGGSPEDRYLSWVGYFTGDLLETVAGERLGGLDGRSTVRAMLADAATAMRASDPAERYMASDIGGYLPGDLLTKMDIATMAASLEGRSPLLDHDLAEFVARVPSAQKVSAFRTKKLLRLAMRGVLPEPILTRRKMGFTAPVGLWLRGPLRALFHDVVFSPRAASRGYVDTAGARRLYAEHASGRTDRTRQLWSLLMLELWFTECVDAYNVQSPVVGTR